MSTQLDVLFCVARDFGATTALDQRENQYEPLMWTVSDSVDRARVHLEAERKDFPGTSYVVLQGVVKWQPIPDVKPGKKPRKKTVRR